MHELGRAGGRAGTFSYLVIASWKSLSALPPVDLFLESLMKLPTPILTSICMDPSERIQPIIAVPIGQNTKGYSEEALAEHHG